LRGYHAQCLIDFLDYVCNHVLLTSGCCLTVLVSVGSWISEHNRTLATQPRHGHSMPTLRSLNVISYSLCLPWHPRRVHDHGRRRLRYLSRVLRQTAPLLEGGTGTAEARTRWVIKSTIVAIHAYGHQLTELVLLDLRWERNPLESTGPSQCHTLLWNFQLGQKGTGQLRVALDEE
jgi:hypothetical protein